MVLPNFPVGAERREAQLMTQVSPQARAWILQEAGRLAGQPVITDQTTVGKVRARFASSGSFSDGDIASIVFLVLMAAAKAAQSDLKAIMAGVKAINDAKERLRQANSATQKNAAGLRPGSLSAFSANNAPKPKPTPTLGRMLTPTAPFAKSVLDSQIRMARDDVDKLSEIGEMESLRLQMMMDRTSKMMSTLSNVLKKMSSSSSSIIGNLK